MCPIHQECSGECGCDVLEGVNNEMIQKARTQKSKGLLALCPYFSVPNLVGIFQDKKEIEALAPYHFASPLFARPCPKTPRHGFVDSRIAATKEELVSVLAETLAADPEGELMVMSAIDAAFNAIWTPHLLCIGEGNDGATAGKDTVSIPLTGAMPDAIQQLLSAAQVGKDADPYIEVITRKGQISPYFTQLRSGPRLGKATLNYIPSDTDVSGVIEVSQSISLLQWEEMMIAASKHKGTVIYHPSGSLTDHYTVHARSFSIPVILDGKRPSPGDHLIKESDDIPLDPLWILKGAIAAEKIDITRLDNRQPAIVLLLTALYNASALGGQSSFWLGAAVSLMIRFGASALRGEARHLYRHRPGADVHKIQSRDAVYLKSLPFSIRRQRAGLIRLISTLRYGNYGSGGVGGEKWAKCGASLLPLVNGLGRLARNPSVEDAQSLVRALNISVDQAHNNGWWLNKFAESGLFNKIQDNRLEYLCQGISAFWAVGKAVQQIDQPSLDRKMSQWASWSPLIYQPPKVTSAALVSEPGIPGLVFELHTRLLGKTMRRLVVPPDKIINAVLPVLGKIHIVPTENGMRVEAKNGKKTIIVMEEKALL